MMAVPRMLWTAQPRFLQSPKCWRAMLIAPSRLWFGFLQAQQKLSCVPLSYEQRCAHLPQVFRDLVLRLQSSQDVGGKQNPSAAAAEHGRARYRQGYSAAMLVEESRILQVSIFQTLHRNVHRIDPERWCSWPSWAIADEVDSQLSQAVASFTLASASAG